MHCFYPLIVSPCKFICRKNIFGVVIACFKQTVVLSFFCLFRFNLLCDLNIYFFILPCCHKVNFSISGFTHIYGVSSPAKLQIHNVFKAGSYAVCVVSEDAVPKRNICKIKFFLRFQNFPALQIIPGTAVEQICLLKLFKIAVNCLVVK